jgi:hypothetical protein
MNAGKPHLPTKIVAFLKFRVGFAGEAYNDIGSDRCLWHYSLNQRHRPLKVTGGITPSHPLKHTIATTLQRKMKMAA